MSVPVVLALDFGGSKMAVTVADADGSRLASTVVPTSPEAGATANFDHGIAIARGLLAGAAAGRTVGAVGASTFGIRSTTGSSWRPRSTAGNSSHSVASCAPRSPVRT